MADTKVEFSQLSKLYSEAKLKYPYLAYDIEQLHETEQKIYEYSVQIPVSYTHLTLPTNSRV